MKLLSPLNRSRLGITFCLSILSIMLTANGFAQLSGVKTIPGDYVSLADFVTDLNAQGVGPGGVTAQIDQLHVETAPVGGYQITATGTSADPISITSSGPAKPVFTASASLVAGSLNDAIIKLVGADYVTISNLELREHSAAVNVTPASNNMTEWGIALLYASVTNGSEFCTLQNNTIVLDRTYTNSSGIYSNSTHSATAPTTAASATGVNGGNNGLKIYGNSISNVNYGIVVVGPISASDQNDGVEIGSNTIPARGNTISNYGTTTAGTTFPNVSSTVNGVLVRNSKNITVSYNAITSSLGGLTTSSTLRGIFIPSASAQVVGNNIININFNEIELQHGFTSGTINGIALETSSANATTDLSVSNNNFKGNTHAVTSTGIVTFISSTATALNFVCSNNTLSNITMASSGTVTFVGHSYTMPTGGSQTLNNNSIVGTFNKTVANGSFIGFTTSASSASGSSATYIGNNFSNLAMSGTSGFTGITNIDGLSTNTSTKSIKNNTFSNITAGSGSFLGINVSYIAGASEISGNQISSNSGSGSLSGISVNSSGNIGTSLLIFNNTISDFSGSSTSSTSTGLTVSNTSPGIEIYDNKIFGISSTSSGIVTGMIISGTTNDKKIYRNKIYNLTSNNAGGRVYGISVTSALNTYIYNNLLSDFKTPTTSLVDAIRGFSITGTTAGSTVGLYYNTLHINASSTGVDFGTSGVYHQSNSTATIMALDMRNNIIINESVALGLGTTVALRRSAVDLANYSTSSNKNLLFAGSPSIKNLIYSDGTNNNQAFINFQTYASPREAASITGEGGYNYSTAGSFFNSLTGTNSDYLKPKNGINTLTESGAADITSPIAIPQDFSSVARPAGSGTAPDMGAYEFDGVAVANCSGMPTAGSISGANAVCENNGTTLSVTGYSATVGITFQWKVASVPGGPYTDLGIAPTQATGNLTANAYYIVDVTCSNSSMTATTSEFTLTVNPNPVISISGADTVCIGLSTTLTASGADTYSWSPAGTLSASTGATVTATPTNTTIYTVVGTTSATNCFTSMPITITTLQGPNILEVTASPDNVCSGSSSVLDVTTSIPSAINQYLFSKATDGVLVDMTGATTLLTNGNDDTPTASSSPIGFYFNFNNNFYSNFSVSPDGWLLLGSATATSQFTNSVVSNLNTPKIYAFWDDLATGTDGYVKHLVTGTAPNRVLVVEWFVTVPVATGGPANSKFQIWLHEKGGKVEMVYGAMNPTSTSASVGMTASSTNYQSITVSTLTNSTTTFNNSNTVTPAAGQKFIFSQQAGANNYLYAWTPAANLSNASAKSPTANNITANGYYAVQTNGFGCLDKDSVFISTGVALESDVTANVPTTQCQGATINLTATPIGGGGPYSYAWTGPNTYTASTDLVVLSNLQPNQSGRYYVTISDACGANKLDSIDILINPNPVVSINPTSNVACQGATGPTLVASGADTYAWTPSATLSASTGSTVVATPTSTITYTATGTFTATGCFAAATQTITYGFNPIVSSVTAVPSTICAGDSSVVSVVAKPNRQVNSMAFSTNTGSTLYPMVSPTIAVPAATDDAVSGVQPIGFSFGFNNTSYTNFSLSPDGWLVLGNTAATNQFTNSVISTSNTPKIYPLWDDLATGTDGYVRYETQGTAPNRRLVAEWFVTIPRVTTGAANSTFQAVLHESTDSIEFIYQPNGNAPSSSIGLTGAANNYQSITVSSATVSTSTPNNANSTSPIIGRRYVFWNQAAPLTYAWNPSATLKTSNADIAQTMPLNSTTTYTPTVTSSLGCSVNGSSVTVTVKPTSAATISPMACTNYTAPSGAIYSASGQYMDTIPNSVGCDSVITINLTINQPTSSSFSVTSCGNYTAPSGAIFSSSGSITDVIQNAAGCDSTMSIQLTVIPNSANTLQIFTCTDYTSPSGLTLTSTGTYMDTIPNAAGCDSVFTIHLVVGAESTATISPFACESYTAPSGAIFSQSGNYKDTILNASGCDSVIFINLTVGQPSSSTLTISNCGDYTSPSGKLFTISGTYKDTILNASGCDSVMTIQLTINNITDAVTVSGATITATESGATYNWLDCNNGLAPILGAISQSYTPFVNGEYAVRISKNGCIDTSVCVLINTIGLDDLEKFTFQILPNPTSGIVLLQFNAESSAVVTIYDASGKVVMTKSNVKNGQTLNLSEQDRGMYLIRLETINGTHIERIIKN